MDGTTVAPANLSLAGAAAQAGATAVTMTARNAAVPSHQCARTLRPAVPFIGTPSPSSGRRSYASIACRRGRRRDGPRSVQRVRAILAATAGVADFLAGGRHDRLSLMSGATEIDLGVLDATPPAFTPEQV